MAERTWHGDENDWDAAARTYWSTMSGGAPGQPTPPSLAPKPSWRNYWRRQTGTWGFYVEWVMWLTTITAGLKVLAWVLEGVVWVLRQVNG